MASNKLFSYGNARNSVKRSPFDLSKRHLFTAKVGELLPIYCKPTLPGDKWTISTDTFTRTQPVSTAAFTRINEYVDFFSYIFIYLRIYSYLVIISIDRKSVV